MSRTDTQEIVEFARKWQQFDGGPDEEIFVTFGLAPDEYFRRLQGNSRRRRRSADSAGHRRTRNGLCTSTRPIGQASISPTRRQPRVTRIRVTRVRN